MKRSPITLTPNGTAKKRMASNPGGVDQVAAEEGWSTIRGGHDPRAFREQISDGRNLGLQSVAETQPYMVGRTLSPGEPPDASPGDVTVRDLVVGATDPMRHGHLANSENTAAFLAIVREELQRPLGDLQQLVQRIADQDYARDQQMRDFKDRLDNFNSLIPPWDNYAAAAIPDGGAGKGKGKDKGGKKGQGKDNDAAAAAWAAAGPAAAPSDGAGKGKGNDKGGKKGQGKGLDDIEGATEWEFVKKCLLQWPNRCAQLDGCAHCGTWRKLQKDANADASYQVLVNGLWNDGEGHHGKLGPMLQSFNTCCLLGWDGEDQTQYHTDMSETLGRARFRTGTEGDWMMTHYKAHSYLIVGCIHCQRFNELPLPAKDPHMGTLHCLISEAIAIQNTVDLIAWFEDCLVDYDFTWFSPTTDENFPLGRRLHRNQLGLQ